MPTYEQLGFGQGASLSGDRARSVFGHVMGLVACTLAFAAGGAYISRNMTGGDFLIFFIAAFAGLFGLRHAAARNQQNLATALLMGVGLLLGLAIGPTVAYYAHTNPGVVYQAAGCTALFTAALGAYGASTQRNLAVHLRAMFWAFLAVFVFGIIALFVAIPGSNIIYCVLMLLVFGFFTAFDFQRLVRNPNYQQAVPIAAAIFLDILNVFLLFLSLFGGGSAAASDKLAIHQQFSRAALGAALFVAGVALGACGGQSSHTSSSTTASMPSLTATSASTVRTNVNTVIGTTPEGQTITETDTQVSTRPAGPDGVAIEPGAPLGPTTTTSPTITGQTIDGIQCNRLTQLAYQTYAHLQVYVDGRPRSLPGAIGLVHPKATVTGTTTTYVQTMCTYWIRTHAANGLVEIDSPLVRTFTLGELFDIWGQKLSRVQVATAVGRVTAMVDGKRWRGNPRAIPLREHESIQLAVGQPVPRFKPINWSVTDL